MKIQESGENYLETILILTIRDQTVRSIDVAKYMGFSKPSVSRAIGLLRSGGFVSVGDGGGISLTDAGREVAETIYERHQYLTRFLVDIGVSPDVAAEDACRMEHVISDESFRAIKKHCSYE